MEDERDLTRRRFIGGTTASLGAAAFATSNLGFPGLARAAPEVSRLVMTQAVTSLAFIQNYIAAELGFFSDEGLEVEIVVTRGGGPDVQAVLAGDAAFTVNDGAQILPAVAKGQNLTCLMATLDRNIINVSMLKETAERLSVGPESPIEDKLTALAGLNIGITRPGSLTWQLARFNLKTAGLDPETGATIVGLGGGPAVAAGLENGDVDAIYISVPLGERVVHSGKAITLIDNANGEDPNLPRFMMEGLWARPEFVAENPNTCHAMIRALSRASEFVLDESVEDVSAALTNTFGALGEDVLAIGVDKVKAAVSRSRVFDQATLDHTQKVLMLNDALDEPFDIDTLFDPRFLEG
mgnify:CR=1 FL=1|jgi:ABC-type nitrate/sulfonate/bicarbonate transport system substrate-binding protein